MPEKKKRYKLRIYSVLIEFVSSDCGEGGIRTLGTVSRTTVFETATIDRSATSPERLPRMGPRGSKSKDFGGIIR